MEILAAQQTQENPHWYQGTADAVRQNMRYFLEHSSEYFVILSGDQLYHMDYRLLLKQHVESGAEITLGTVAGDTQGCVRIRHHAQRLVAADHPISGKAERRGRCSTN